VILEKPKVKEMHGFYSREEDWIPIWQIEERGPSNAVIFEKGLLFIKAFRIPPTLRKLNLLSDITFRPSTPVKVFYILDPEVAASTKIGCRWACKSASLACS
jgi:hypothetical protein